MIEIHGKSGCIKHIHSTLIENGITEFQSIKEVNQFTSTYNQRINELRKSTYKTVQETLEALRTEKTQKEKDKVFEIEKLEEESYSIIKRLDSSIQTHRNREYDPKFKRMYSHLIRKYSLYKLNKVEVKFESKITNIKIKYDNQIDSISQKIHEHITDPDKIADRIMEKELQRLKRTKDKIEELYPFIAGAIGESKVIKSLEQLSCEAILINDYNLSFKPPIFNPKDKKTIKSIQLDHLLLTRAGLFIIETKNWSKESIEDHDLRSPVAQINRSSYALFKFLNDSNRSGIKHHHWGQKEIPIRNIIAMTNAKPSVSFKFVKIKSLSELVGYIEHFPNQFDSEDIRTLGEFLLRSQDKNVKISNRRRSMPKQTKTINEMYRDL